MVITSQYKQQILLLSTLNPHNVPCQLYLNKHRIKELKKNLVLRVKCIENYKTGHKTHTHIDRHTIYNGYKYMMVKKYLTSKNRFSIILLFSWRTHFNACLNMAKRKKRSSSSKGSHSTLPFVRLEQGQSHEYIKIII